MKLRLILFICVCAHWAQGQSFYSNTGLANSFQEGTKFSNTNETNLLRDISDVSVDYRTGQGSVNIPVYKISEGGISTSIDLSYSTSGIKVEEEASWVGLGWALNTGAFISREIRGRADETYYTVPGNNTWIQSWNNYCNTVMQLPYGSYFVDGTFDKFIKRSGEWMSPCGSANGPTRDIQPDLYSIRLQGKKIEFIFDPDQNIIKLTNDNNYKIIYNSGSFTVIDESGIKYFFDIADREKLKFDNSTNTAFDPVNSNLTYYNGGAGSNGYNEGGGCTSQSNYGSYLVPIKWNLSKIESPDLKYNINFDYDDYTYWQYRMSFIYNIDKSSLSQFSYTYLDPNVTLNGNITQDHSVFSNLIFNQYSCKRLKKISWSKGYVTFEANTLRSDVLPAPNGYTDQCKRLDFIKIFASTGSEIKRFGFNYSHFNSAITLTDAYRSKRLKLLSLQEFGSDLTSHLPPYTFEYDNNNLPVVHSYEQDFWGYYRANGAKDLQGKNYFYANYSNTDLNDFKLWSPFCIYPISLPGSGTPVTINGNDRLPNLTNTQACVLKKVITPMGGYKKLEYELNTFCIDNDLVNRNAGGLRIKKLTYGDGVNTSKDIVTNFSYDYESTFLSGSVKRSSGEINFLPVFGREAIDAYQTGQADAMYKIHSDNFAGSVNSSNSQVFYKEVAVSIQGRGSTIYRFETAGTFGHNSDVTFNGGPLIAKQKSENAHINIDSPSQGWPISNLLPDHLEVLHKRSNYPYALEPNTDWINGSLKEVEIRDENGFAISKTINNYTIKSADKIRCYEINPILESWDAFQGSTLNPTNVTSFGHIHRGLMLVPYDYISVWRVLSSQTEYLFDPQSPGNISNAQVKITNFDYTGSYHKFLSSKNCIGSDGRNIIEKYKYAADFIGTYIFALINNIQADVPGVALLRAIKTNQLKLPVEQIIIQNIGSTNEIVNGNLFTYKDIASNSFNSNINPVIRNFEDYTFENPSPLNLSSFNNSTLPISGSTAFGFDPHFKRKLTYQKFDSNGNILQSKIENSTESSTLYGYNSSIPIAEAYNAKFSEIAYTSFESDEVSNWSHYGNNIVTSEKKTGEKCYSFSPSNSQGTNYDLILNKQIGDIDQSGKYVFSCWIKTPITYVNNSSFIVVQSNNGSNLTSQYPTVNSAYKSVPIQKTYGKWVFYSTTIDLKKIRSDAGLNNYPSGPGLGLRYFMYNTSTTTNFYVDDIRIRPYESVMNSFTLKPLIGITSNMDNSDISETYEYDVFGRKILTRNLDDNVVEKIKYNYKSCTNCQ